MPAYDRTYPPWGLEDKRHSFRNEAAPPSSCAQWKELSLALLAWTAPSGSPAPSRQPAYDELRLLSGSLRRLSLQPRPLLVPPRGQGSYSRSRLYSPPAAQGPLERLPPRSEDIYADPAAYVMRRSISSPQGELPALPRLFLSP